MQSIGHCDYVGTNVRAVVHEPVQHVEVVGSVEGRVEATNGSHRVTSYYHCRDRWTIATRKHGMASYWSLLTGGAYRLFGGTAHDIGRRIRRDGGDVGGEGAYRCREVIGVPDVVVVQERHQLSASVLKA
jgi:hypothetical protein